jgi:prepilin-type processing-associated H-X9-DG protein
MYQEDNSGRIMSSTMNTTLSDGTHVGWIGTPRDAAGTLLTSQQTNPVTDEDEIRGIEWGALWPYVKAPDAYNCPGDKVKSVHDGGEKLVTYGIPYALNAYPESSTIEQIRKYGELTTPGLRYVFVETAETRNYTMSGRWIFATPEITGVDKYGWWGPMAVNHGDSSNLGFVDGHAENHKWQDSYTKARVEKLVNQGGGWYGKVYPGDIPEFPIDMVTDLNYMVKGWPYRYKR